MPKQIRLNSVDMNCVAHQSLALWAHPRDRADHYNTLDGTVKLAESKLGGDRVGRVNGRDEDASRRDLRRPSLPS